MSITRTLYSGFQSQQRLLESGRLVEAILLFDMVLFSDSTTLPCLINSVGAPGLMRLLEEGRIALAGGFPTAQGTYDYKHPGFFRNRPLDRPFRYGFETIYVDPNKPNNPLIEERIAKDLENTGCETEQRNQVQNQLLITIRVIDPESLTFFAATL